MFVIYLIIKLVVVLVLFYRPEKWVEVLLPSHSLTKTPHKSGYDNVSRYVELEYNICNLRTVQHLTAAVVCDVM